MNRIRKRIVLAVTGLSPQVVTETLYALSRESQGNDLPTEVHLVTTAQGAEHAGLNLLSEDPGWFHRLCRDYQLSHLVFDIDHIHVIHDADGNPLADIRTPADNECAADAITERVRQFTEQDDTALHVSIAGGRKTMGFYLGYALSLYGRPQDRLSHVLVSSPFESHPQFYYPTPYQRVIHSLDKTQLALDCRSAEVTLAEIPFVSLRHGLPNELLQGQASFSAVVNAARKALAPPRLRLDLIHRRIVAGDTEIKLPPSELALLTVFARAAKTANAALPAPPKDAKDLDWANRYLQERRIIAGDMADLDNAERALKHGMDGDYFSQLLSKLHRRIKRTLGPAAGPYLIDDGGTRPRRYRLKLPMDAVTLLSD